jgi:hypothetical protein
MKPGDSPLPGDQSQAVSDPAARLIGVLQNALAQSANTTLAKMWSKTFGLGEDDYVGIYHGLYILNDLCVEVERAIIQLPNIRHEQYLKVLPKLKGILARPSLQENWDKSRPILQMVCDALEFSSERLQALAPEPVIPESELSAIRMQAEALLDLLTKSSEIPHNLKTLLFDIVKALLRSIDEYHFRGIRGVRRELFVVASQIQENLSQFEKNSDAKEVTTFFSFFKKIDSITSTALKVKELLGAVAPLLMQVGPLVEHTVR